MMMQRRSFLVGLSLLTMLRIDAFTPSSRRSMLKRSYAAAAVSRGGSPFHHDCFHVAARQQQHHRSSRRHGNLWAENPSSNYPSSYQLKDSIMKEAVMTLRRTSWLSWWSQMILTVISTVILGFAKTSNAKDGPSLVLSGAAIFISGLSIVWTWGNGTRLSRRLQTKPATRGAAANMLRRAVRVGAMLNMAGLLCNLLAAQEIIGGLALKVLTQRQSLLDGGLQPLDVLVVQANANSLLSHYISLACLLYLTNLIARLDPPSRDGVDDV
jgi:Protein of unknown function (DUF3611)